MSSITPDFVSVNALVSEAERYLATVDYFRSQGCEPRWSGETTPPETTLVDTEPNHAKLERHPDELIQIGPSR